jgi:putative two-component system response regulator
MAYILIVDDDEAVRGPLSAQLEARRHVCDLASNGAEAVQRVLATEYDLILSDIRMPVMDGIQFLEAVRDLIDTVTPCLILTGFSDVSYATKAIRVGAYDFIRKPWDITEMEIAVDRALLRRADLKFRRDYQQELERRVQEAVADLKRAYDGTVVGFAALLEGKDTTTAEHCTRVKDLCVRLAREVGVPPAKLRDLELGAMLHDIGKCKIPDAILNKAGPLTSEEWEVMRKHPTYGAEIVERIDFLATASDVVRNHHEKFDGSGYPRGLKGEDIPLAARIFMIVDAYDTITSRRSYKDAQAPEAALREIQRCAGTHFDPALVEAFERIYPAIAAATLSNAALENASIGAPARDPARAPVTSSRAAPAKG